MIAVAVDRAEVMAVVRRLVEQERLAGATVSWNGVARRQGEPIRIGGRDHPMPFDGTVAFVDLAPRYNWAHPCLYVLVRSDGSGGEVVPASFPPLSGEAPYVEIMRYGEAVAADEGCGRPAGQPEGETP